MDEDNIDYESAAIEHAKIMMVLSIAIADSGVGQQVLASLRTRLVSEPEMHLLRGAENAMDVLSAAIRTRNPAASLRDQPAALAEEVKRQPGAN